MSKLHDMEGSATLVLSNSFALTIVIDDSGDNVMYQYSNEDDYKEAEIEYIEDTENRTGYADTENGYESRKHYLKCLSDEYGVPYGTVTTLAEMLGSPEDFDGLISALEDAEEMFGEEW